MVFLIAIAVGLASGVHTATWGMYKDCPHEGFAWWKYFRSILLSVPIAAAWQAGAGLDLSQAQARLVLFGLTYVTERGLGELYKTFFFPHRPRGKFAGKPILFPQLLAFRRAFVPGYVAVWAALLLNLAIAFAEPRQGLLSGSRDQPAVVTTDYATR